MNEEVEITLLQDEVSVETPLVADYILPTATASTLGGVKIGDNIDIDSTGHISVPIATDSTVGLVKAGTGLTITSDGTLTATGTYELPEATKNTLGGVYVDDELSTTSTHPVQNATISLAIDDIDDDISDLSTTVSGLSTNVGNLSTTVGNLSTTVGGLSTTVSTQGGTITTLSSNITTLGNGLAQAESDIDDLEIGLDTASENVGALMLDVDETITYSDIDNLVWTNGDIRIEGKGSIAFVYFNLEGSLTIASGSDEDIYTISDDELKPLYLAHGVLITDDGVLHCAIDTTGVITLYNMSASSITLTKLRGNVPIVLS